MSGKAIKAAKVRANMAVKRTGRHKGDPQDRQAATSATSDATHLANTDAHERSAGMTEQDPSTTPPVRTDNKVDPSLTVVHCEGCEASQFTTRLLKSGRPSNDGFPMDWCQTGRSRKQLGSIASWCQACSKRFVWRHWVNPSEAEVKQLIRERDLKAVR